MQESYRIVNGIERYKAPRADILIRFPFAFLPTLGPKPVLPLVPQHLCPQDDLAFIHF